jgi:ABC-type Mn2+/Zn2+ transport system permease subunit
MASRLASSTSSIVLISVLIGLGAAIVGYLIDANLAAALVSGAVIAAAAIVGLLLWRRNPGSR